MTHCERLSDRMPEVARGTATWSRDDAAHLAVCEECQEEWQLIRAAATHGMTVALRVDAGRLAEQVERRLRREPAATLGGASRFRRAAWPAAIAAGLALMVWAGPRVDPEAELSAGATLAVLHELDDLSDTELEAMLGAVEDPTASDFRTLDTPESLSDLSDAELELLLRSMED